MTTIRTLMTDDHRHCDDLFAAVEEAIAGGDLAQARQHFANFADATLAHFESEEEILFPAFEHHTGITGGPTEMMRREHVQLRQLLETAGQALMHGDHATYLAEADTLLIMVQQHNMKEENILYPMCDHRLAEQAGEMTARLREGLHGHQEVP